MMKPTIRIFGIVLAVVMALTLVTALVDSQNMNSRFSDGDLVQKSLTATTGTITSLGTTTLTATSGTIATLGSTTATIGTANVTTLNATTFTGSRATQNIRTITAAADTFYSSGTYKISGDAFIARPLGQKSTLFLQSAVAGAWLDVMVADTDSLRIVAASGDSILASTGVAARSIGSVAGTVRLLAIDTVRWVMLNTLGTWTPDNGTQ